MTNGNARNNEAKKLDISPKQLASLLLFFVALIMLCIGALIIGSFIGIPPTQMAMTFSPAAFVLSAIIAFLAWQHSKHNSEEPWIRSFRNIHREFWNDKEIASVRKWLCCDEAYIQELQPVIQKRLNGQVTAEEYDLLESVDRYCSIMSRFVYIDVKIRTTKAKKEIEAWDRLGFMFWLNKLKERTQVKEYVYNYWPNLKDYLESINNSLHMNDPY